MFQDDPETSGDAFVLSNPSIYGTCLVYDTVSKKLLPWEAWGKRVEFEIAEMENPFGMEDAKTAKEILGPWIERLLKVEWMPSGDETVTELTMGEGEVTVGNVDEVPDL